MLFFLRRFLFFFDRDMFLILSNDGFCYRRHCFWSVRFALHDSSKPFPRVQRFIYLFFFVLKSFLRFLFREKKGAGSWGGSLGSSWRVQRNPKKIIPYLRIFFPRDTSEVCLALAGPHSGSSSFFYSFCKINRTISNSMGSFLQIYRL